MYWEKFKVEIKEEQTSPEPEPRSFGGKVSPQQDEPINFAQVDAVDFFLSPSPKGIKLPKKITPFAFTLFYISSGMQ